MLRLPLFLALNLLLVASGCTCRGENLRPTLPPGVRVDTYTQQAASKIDVLWVVDNSGSMAPRQENLGRNFQAFINEFTQNAIDYRIAVTTTDIFREKGAFVGNPSVLSPSTPSVINAFASNVKVGIDGSPYEVGMEAARLAVERQMKTNDALIEHCKRACPPTSAACPSECEEKTQREFLRPDAYLYLIFVSDEDDKSNRDVRYFYRFFETAKGVGNDAMVTTAAIMGDVPSNDCGATPGTKYEALSQLTGGAVGSICDANFSTTLKKLASNAVGLRRTFSLQSKPNAPTLEVRVRYPCNIAKERTASCASVDSRACAGNPIDSFNVVCVPAQAETDGWTYQSSNNLVFFSGEAVPGLGAQIELQYYEEGIEP